MALFRYRVSDPAGKVSDLLIEGDSQSDATRRIQRRGLLPLEFLGEGSAAGSRTGLSLRRRFDVVDFTDRLVPLLEAKIPLERALGIVGEGMEDPPSGKLVGELRRGLHEGRKFSDMIRDRGRVFPNLYGSVVAAGEEAGALPQVMGEMRRFLSESRELRAFVVSAAIYPVFVIAASMVMLSIVIWVIVPRFAAVLRDTGRTGSAATSALLFLSDAAHRYWWGAPVILLLVAFLIHGIRREDGRLRAAYDRWILKVPIAGRLVLYANLARLTRTMSVLMRSGVHILDTVSIANRVVQNRTLSQSVAGLSGELRRGQRLSHALGQSRFVPAFVIRMLAVGEETGEVEAMLDRVAERYEADMKRLIRRLLALMEPILILLLGLFVGGIVLLMFLAILDMQNVV